MLIFTSVWIPDRRPLFETKGEFLIVISTQFGANLVMSIEILLLYLGKSWKISMRSPLALRHFQGNGTYCCAYSFHSSHNREILHGLRYIPIARKNKIANR